MKLRKWMPDEPGNDTCIGDPQLLHLAVRLSLDLSQNSRPALSYWPAGPVPPPHPPPSRQRVRSRCSSVTCRSGAQSSIQAWILCHITAVASSATCHPDAGPWITSGYRFLWVMPLITKGFSDQIRPHNWFKCEDWFKCSMGLPEKGGGAFKIFFFYFAYSLILDYEFKVKVLIKHNGVFLFFNVINDHNLFLVLTYVRKANGWLLPWFDTGDSFRNEAPC